MKLDQTLMYIIFAAVIAGMWIGGSIIIWLVKIISRNMRPPSRYGDDYDSERQEPRIGGCFPVIFMFVIAGIIFFKVANSKFIKEIQGKGESGIINAPIETRKDQYSINEQAEPKETLPSPENVIENPKAEIVDEPVILEEAPDPHVVRVGAFTDAKSAQQKMLSETNKGLRTGYYIVANKNGVDLFAVFVGAYRTKQDAKDVLYDINEQGAFIVPASDLELHYFEGR